VKSAQIRNLESLSQKVFRESAGSETDFTYNSF
jgi:hypothetical protein